MIDKITFFNDETINVFTDASVKNHGQITESVAGALIIDNKANHILRRIRLIPSTNNEGEIYAIFTGLMLIYEHMSSTDKKYTYNLFSDSKISVYGLREWYESWIKYSTGKDYFISSSGEPVKNQEIFIRCMDMIIRGEIHVNIYHVRGHMQANNHIQYQKFIKDFKESNHLSSIPTNELVKELIRMNDIVDNATRSALLPEGRSIEGIPTIMGIHKKDTMSEFMGTPIKKEFLFTHNKGTIVSERKRYAALIELPKI